VLKTKSASISRLRLPFPAVKFFIPLLKAIKTARHQIVYTTWFIAIVETSGSSFHFQFEFFPMDSFMVLKRGIFWDAYLVKIVVIS